jgi:hypothetical protein
MDMVDTPDALVSLSGEAGVIKTEGFRQSRKHGEETTMNIKFHAGANAVRLGTFVLAALWGQNLLAANIVQVGNCQNKTGYSTITLGVAAVSPGGLILVCPGVYSEQVTINKPLTITGLQVGTSDAVVIVPPAGGLRSHGELGSSANCLHHAPRPLQRELVTIIRTQYPLPAAQ